MFGVVRRAANGTLTRVAGQYYSNGVTTEGAPALNTYFQSIGPLALVANETSLYMSLEGTHMVRRIDGLDGSGTVTTVAGTAGSSGFSGDYGPATSAQLYRPFGLALTPGGHLVISDYYNYAFRMVW